nr:biotin acceptor peptide [Expression vector pBIG-5b]
MNDIFEAQKIEWH